VPADHAQVDLVRPDALLDHPRVPDAQRDRDARIAAPEGGDDAREHVDPRCRAGADHERPALEPFQLVERPTRARDRRGDAGGVLLEQAAGFGQGHGAAEPVEEADTELALQLEHVLRERRLAHV
jgi:hypothetical protein